MAVNKVVFDGKTLIDVSDSTVTPQTLSQGETAYDKSGLKITGKATPDRSLGITAATVGQIAKITAVEKGVPTAWEAVNLPSGGGDENWREIITVEIPDPGMVSDDKSGITWYANEDGGVLRFVIDKDFEGNAFSLKKVLIRASMTSADKVTTATLNMAINKYNTYNLDNLSIGQMVKNDSAQAEIQIECRPPSGAVSIFGSRSNNAPYGSTTNGSFYVTPNSSFAGRNGLNITSINKFLFWTTTPIKPGEVMRIWGVDE